MAGVNANAVTGSPRELDGDDAGAERRELGEHVAVQVDDVAGVRLGPRSPTRHCAVRPFAVLRIVTMVPNGRLRWAQEPDPAWLSYQLAEPVWYERRRWSTAAPSAAPGSRSAWCPGAGSG